MKALITGATGFIGSHLAQRLLKNGYDVSCLVRKTSELKWLQDLNVRLIQGDFSDNQSLLNCVKDNDYIFHLAGLTKSSRKKDFYLTNSTGTKNFIEAVAESNPGLKRFVYVSSLSAVGPGTKTRVPSEDQEPKPVSDYGKSKLMGEQAVLKFRDKVAVSIIRPAVVYGPRDAEFFLIFKCIKNRVMPYWGDGHLSMVYVDDLLNAILLAAENQVAVGATFHISDGKIYSNNEIINEISSALGVSAMKVKLPKAALKPIGFLGDGISRIVGKSSMINSDKVKELKCTDWVCTIDKASRDLGFKPGVGIKEGIKWTADWYRIHKWL